MSYMGFCASSGADYMNHLIADRVVAPPDLRFVPVVNFCFGFGFSSYSVGLNNFFSNSAQFSEHLVLLPHSYFVTDHRQQPAWAGIPDPSVSRKEYPELPGSGLLLACFNQVIITWFSVCCSLLVLNSIRTQISRFDIWYCMICSQLYKIDSEVFGVWMQVLLARCFFLIIIIILYCDVVPFHFQKTVYIWRMGFVASILRGRGQIFC